MFFKHFYDEDLAQGSYLIGCQTTGEAIVVDARRDIAVYLEEASRQGLKISAVTETHIHADYLSGSRELANATGATLYLSDEGNADWKYSFEGDKLYHGSRIKLGNIIVEAVHTPGHTPEHLSFLVTDGAAASQPGYYLTGDFVFVGDIGRPDLLDEAAGGIDTRFVGAKQLFASLRDHFLTLPDYVQVWPAHGAGSACGKSLGAVASTTVGYERSFAWWAPYIERGDEQGFTDALLAGQPDAPLYFGRMKKQNKEGPALLGARADLLELSVQDVQQGLEQSSLIFVDTRNRARHLDAHPVGALFIPWGKSFTTYASYSISPEHDNRPIVLLADNQVMAHAMRDRLSYVGIDNVQGYLTSTQGLPSVSSDVLPVKDINPEQQFVLDVRTANEHQTGHLPNAKQLHVGRVIYNLDTLPKDKMVVVHCQTGGRATVAASALRAAGYDKVYELEGSYEGWLAQQPETASA
ncbi:MAG: MBL fold metallo-hydrolase [Deinococcota bacterium]